MGETRRNKNGVVFRHSYGDNHAVVCVCTGSQYRLRYAACVEHIANEGAIGTIFYLVISVCLISGGMFLYLWFEDRDFLYEGKNVNMLFVILEVSMLTMYAIGKWMSVYARPFALCALLVLMVSDRRKAVYMNCVVCLLVFMSDAFVSVDMNENRSLYATLVIGFITSTMAIYLVD